MSIISLSVSTYRRGALASGVRRAPVPRGPRARAAASRRRRLRGVTGVGPVWRGRAECWCPCSAPAARAIASASAPQGLRPQVRRADGVGVVDDGGTASLVPSHRQGQAEREDEADQPEQRGLQDPERLAKVLRPVTKVMAEDETEAGRAEDDHEQDEPELEATEPKEHVRSPLLWRRHRNADAGRAAGSVVTETV